MRTCLVLAVLLTCACPALAQTSCVEPPVPPTVDGAQANADQLRTAMAQARDFMAQSEVYQGCLTQSGDPEAKTKIAASARAEETVGQAANLALDTYKKTH